MMHCIFTFLHIVLACIENQKIKIIVIVVIINKNKIKINKNNSTPYICVGEMLIPSLLK
jgi:hypothetical protein